MRTVLMEPNARATLGRSGDTGITVQFDALAWYTDYPAGLPYLMVIRPGGVRTPVTVTYADGLISGEVPDELLVRPGLYSYVFAWVSAGEQVMSSPCGALVLDGVSRRWEPHSTAPDWAERIFLAAESIEGKTDGVVEAAAAAQEAQEGAEAAQEAAEAAQEAAEDAQEAAEGAQAAAEAVQASIPEDYSELSSDVVNLKSALNYTGNYVFNKNLTPETGDYFELETGDVNTTTGMNLAGQDKCCRTKFIPYPAGINGLVAKLNVSGYKITCWSYSGTTGSSATHANTDGRKPGDELVTIPKRQGDAYIRFAFRRDDYAVLTTDTTDSTSDYYIIQHALQISYYEAETDDTLSQENVPADGKATGDAISALETEIAELGDNTADTYVAKGQLTSSDDLDTVTANGVYYWGSSSKPANYPANAGTLIVFTPKTSVANYKSQVVISNGDMFYRFKSSAGWGNWVNHVNSQTMNLYDISSAASNSMVTIAHNDDESITITTKSESTSQYTTLLTSDKVQKNHTYQVTFEVVSCESTKTVDNVLEAYTPKISVRFFGTFVGANKLGVGLRTITKPGVYSTAIYTGGFEKALGLFVTGSGSDDAANATVTVKNIMVADYPWHLPYAPYGKSTEDITARALTTGQRADGLSWGKANFQAMVRQFVNVTYTPLVNLPSQFKIKNDNYFFQAGSPVQGVPYSSARGVDRMIGMHVSLYTFLSAINNPRSVLYTRRLKYNNAGTYYGTVCSAFANYVYGEKINLTTSELIEWEKLTPESFMALEVGDLLWVSTPHVSIVYDVTRDEYGRVTSVTVAEAGNPVVKWTHYTWDSFANFHRNYVARRYKDIDSVPYTIQPSVKGFLDEVPEDVVYPDIMSEYGDKVAILQNEDILINVIDSTGYSRIDVYIDGTKDENLSTTTLSDFTIPNAAPGSYEIKMIGSGKESVTKFIVVQATCSYDDVTHILTFSSENATPHCVLTYTSYPDNHYVPLTEVQLQSGEVDLTNHVGMTVTHGGNTFTYQYAKVNFMTEYGVATWYSYFDNTEHQIWEPVS